MEYIYSAMLLHSAGQPVNETNIKKVMEAAGIKPEEAKIKALVSALEGVNISEVISKAAMPVAVASTSAAPSGGEAPKKEEKQETEEDHEKKVQEAVGGLASLFG
ncbi:MAG: 50S ribosomal protein P1 [Candidatus Aenigmatarchaeota archaeon]